MILYVLLFNIYSLFLFIVFVSYLALFNDLVVVLSNCVSIV